MAIAPESRQRGLGRALLVQVMEQFKGHWFLEVRESNAKARRLYEGVGFAVTRRRKNYYSAPLEDGLEMSKHS